MDHLIFLSMVLMLTGSGLNDGDKVKLLIIKKYSFCYRLDFWLFFYKCKICISEILVSSGHILKKLLFVWKKQKCFRRTKKIRKHLLEVVSCGILCKSKIYFLYSSIFFMCQKSQVPPKTNMGNLGVMVFINVQNWKLYFLEWTS